MLPSSKIQKLVYHEQKQLIKHHIDNWLLGFKKGRFETKYFDGETICYEGVKFEGSPRNVFLNDYIEPFLLDATDRLIDAASNIFKNSKVNSLSAFSKLRSEITNFYDCTYSRMAHVDRALRANGNPSALQLHDFSENKQRMVSYLNDVLFIAASSFSGPSDLLADLRPYSIKAEQALDESLSDFNECLTVIKGKYIGAGQSSGSRELKEINGAVKSSFDAACKSIGIVFSDAWTTQNFPYRSLSEEQERVLSQFHMRIKSTIETPYAKAYFLRGITPPWHQASTIGKSQIRKTIIKSLSTSSMPLAKPPFRLKLRQRFLEQGANKFFDYWWAWVFTTLSFLLYKFGLFP